MPQLIALDPSLGISMEEFVTAWNQSEHAEEGKLISQNEPTRSLSPDPTTMMAIFNGVIAISTGVLTAFVSELLKKKFIDKDKPKITTTTIETPDGTPLLIIKTQES